MIKDTTLGICSAVCAPEDSVIVSVNQQMCLQRVNGIIVTPLQQDEIEGILEICNE